VIHKSIFIVAVLGIKLAPFFATLSTLIAEADHYEQVTVLGT
jgi:hypothetical protein